MAKKRAVDKLLFLTIVLLVAVGLVMVYSASTALARQRTAGLNPFLLRQGLAAALGLAAMYGLMHLDYRRLRRPEVVLGAVGAVILLLVAVLFAPERNGSHRWFLLGGFSFQPSETAKLALVLFLAYLIDRKGEFVNHREFLVPAFGMTGLLAGLVVLEPDLGTAVLLFSVALTMVFLAGLSWRYVALGAGLLLPAAVALVLIEPYRVARIFAFLDPEADPRGIGYQILNSLIAVGSGGVTGRGLGESLQKLYFLPQPHSDFVFSILAEELGLIGALAVVTLFGVLLWRGALAGWRAPDAFGRFLAWGITSALIVQALINVSVTVALLPTKGIPLPFISYGGSSLLVTLAGCGVLLNLSEHG